MSALEREIIEKFRQLTPESRLRMLSTLQHEVTAHQQSIMTWLAEAEAVRFTPNSDTDGYTPTTSELVNEAREERDADIS